MNRTDPRDAIADLQRLTREYASFSRSRGGLGNVLGDVVGLVVFGAVWLLGGSLAAAVIAVGLNFLWLVGKEVIRQHLYLRFGRARELWTGKPRREHQLATLIITLFLLAFAVEIVAGGWLGKLAWPYLVFCLLMPWIVWRYLHTGHEIAIGVGLLFMCAVTASSHAPALLVLLFRPAYRITPKGKEAFATYWERIAAIGQSVRLSRT
jgi:hypothetical protein